MSATLFTHYRKIPAKLDIDTPQVIPFETAIAAKMKQQYDGHHLA
jgi:hypothetical protein